MEFLRGSIAPPPGIPLLTVGLLRNWFVPGRDLSVGPREHRRLGGVISDRMIFEDAILLRARGERLTSYGYFNLNGKRYVVATYFPTRSYWRRLARNVPTHLSSIIFPGAYLRSKKIDELVRGIRVYDGQSRFVEYEKSLYLSAVRAVRIWIRVYLDPFYPPKPRYFDARLTALRKITEISKKRRGIKLQEGLHEYYVDQIRKADEQMVQYLAAIERRNEFLHKLTSVFVSVSDNPSSINMDELLRKAQRFEALLEELRDICEQRAKSWPEIQVARTLLDSLRVENKSVARRYGPRALFDGVIGVLFGVLSGGSLAVGFLFSVSAELGFGFLRNFVLSPKRQANRLLAEARSYQKSVERVRDFISLYKLRPEQGTFRV